MLLSAWFILNSMLMLMNFYFEKCFELPKKDINHGLYSRWNNTLIRTVRNVALTFFTADSLIQNVSSLNW